MTKIITIDRTKYRLSWEDDQPNLTNPLGKVDVELIRGCTHCYRVSVGEECVYRKTGWYTLTLGTDPVPQYEKMTYPKLGPYAVFLVNRPHFNEVHLLGLTLEEIPFVPKRSPIEDMLMLPEDVEEKKSDPILEPRSITLYPDDYWAEPSDDRENGMCDDVDGMYYDMYDVHINPWHARSNRGTRSSQRPKKRSRGTTRPHHDRRHVSRKTREDPIVWDQFHPSNRDENDRNDEEDHSYHWESRYWERYCSENYHYQYPWDHDRW